MGADMMEHGVAEFSSLLAEIGFVHIQTGPTSSSFLGYLSGKKG